MKATKEDYVFFHKLHLIKDVAFFLNCDKIEYCNNKGFLIEFYNNEVKRCSLLKFLYCCLGIYYIKIIYNNDVYYIYDLNDLQAVQKRVLNENIHITKLRVILLPIIE